MEEVGREEVFMECENGTFSILKISISFLNIFLKAG
jgi:hypothetical protein